MEGQAQIKSQSIKLYYYDELSIELYFQNCSSILFHSTKFFNGALEVLETLIKFTTLFVTDIAGNHFMLSWEFFQHIKLRSHEEAIG